MTVDKILLDDDAIAKIAAKILDKISGKQGIVCQGYYCDNEKEPDSSKQWIDVLAQNKLKLAETTLARVASMPLTQDEINQVAIELKTTKRTTDTVSEEEADTAVRKVLADNVLISRAVQKKTMCIPGSPATPPICICGGPNSSSTFGCTVCGPNSNTIQCSCGGPNSSSNFVCSICGPNASSSFGCAVCGPNSNKIQCICGGPNSSSSNFGCSPCGPNSSSNFTCSICGPGSSSNFACAVCGPHSSSSFDCSFCGPNNSKIACAVCGPNKPDFNVTCSMHSLDQPFDPGDILRLSEQVAQLAAEIKKLQAGK